MATKLLKEETWNLGKSELMSSQKYRHLLDSFNLLDWKHQGLLQARIPISKIKVSSKKSWVALQTTRGTEIIS